MCILGVGPGTSSVLANHVAFVYVPVAGVKTDSLWQTSFGVDGFSRALLVGNTFFLFLVFFFFFEKQNEKQNQCKWAISLCGLFAQWWWKPAACMA